MFYFFQFGAVGDDSRRLFRVGCSDGRDAPERDQGYEHRGVLGP